MSAKDLKLMGPRVCTHVLITEFYYLISYHKKASHPLNNPVPLVLTLNVFGLLTMPRFSPGPSAVTFRGSQPGLAVTVKGAPGTGAPS